MISADWERWRLLVKLLSDVYGKPTFVCVHIMHTLKKLPRQENILYKHKCSLTVSWSILDVNNILYKAVVEKQTST